MNDPRELALYYSAADVLLFTSIAENFPLVILEAMSCGLPIVAFDVGGVKEVLEHEKTGYLASYLNVPNLIAGIDWVFGLPPDQKTALGNQSSAKIATQYDTKQMVTAYQNLYQNLVTTYDTRH